MSGTKIASVIEDIPCLDEQSSGNSYAESVGSNQELVGNYSSKSVISFRLCSAYQSIRHKSGFSPTDRVSKALWIHLQNKVNYGYQQKISLFQLLGIAEEITKLHEPEKLTKFRGNDSQCFRSSNDQTYDIGPMVVPDYSQWEDILPPSDNSQSSQLTVVGHPSSVGNQAGASRSKRKAYDDNPTVVVSAINSFENLPTATKMGLMDRFDPVAQRVWFSNASPSDQVEYMRHVNPHWAKDEYEEWEDANAPKSGWPS